MLALFTSDILAVTFWACLPRCACHNLSILVPRTVPAPYSAPTFNELSDGAPGNIILRSLAPEPSR